MRKFWLLILLVLMIIGCENDSSQNSNLISLVPANASFIIKTKSLEGLKSVLKNNDLLSGLGEYSNIKNIQEQLHYTNYLKPSDDILISIGVSEKNEFQIALITKYHADLFKLDSVPNRSVETYTSNNLSISKTTINDHIIYSTVQDSIFFASNDKTITENAFNEDRVIDEELKKLYQTANAEKTASVLINAKQQKLHPTFFLTEDLNNVKLSDYYMLDCDWSQDELIFNGITKVVDTSKSLLHVFKNTVPQENKVAQVCPPDADGFLSFTFNNYKTFSDNLMKFRKTQPSDSYPIFDTATEVGVIYKGNERAIIVTSLDAASMNDILLTQTALETYREVDIYPFDMPDLFKNHFAPFIVYNKVSKYANIDDFFVFSDNDVLMKEIISHYQNTSTISETPAFKSTLARMSDESSLFVYANAESLNTILNTNFSEDLNLTIDSYRASAIQFIQDHDFAHVNAVIQKSKSKASANTVSEDVSVTLDNDILNNPQLVKNHTNNQMEIVVQDVNNNLYLISHDGKVLWKKQLEGRILGNVEQIDMYKNGRLQLAFATPNRVYVLDRNGKDVSPFPLKFNDNITQPLSVFDYDNKRDYRLMVVQGKSVLMYDAGGKIVSGFIYKKADNTINTQPKHFRIGRKDYLVFVQGNELEILDRTGRTRVTVKNNIAFSDNEIFIYENKFTATTATGDLIQIDEDGKMSSMNLNLGEKHAMTATNKTLVTLSDNILNIKSHRIEMDFGTYTDPQIFYLNDKIYISVTDLQTKKVYLFDSLGKEISNFPVYGNSSIELENMDNGKGLEFVTKGDSNSILIYHMN